MLSFSQLETFIAIVDEGSFQSAAARLNCSQPSVSQQLRRLEELLGVRLVTRNRTRSTLTRDGEAFLPHARALLSSASRAADRLQGRALQIAASSNIGIFIAPRLIKSFETSHRKVSVELKIASNRAAIDAALSGEADVALTEWTEDHSGYDWLAWRREKLVVIVAPGHPLARRKRVTKKAIKDFRLIGGEPGTGTGRILREFFGSEMQHLKLGIELGSTAAVKEAVKADLGISIVMQSAAAEDARHGSLVCLEFEEADIFKTLHAVLPREVPSTARARAFLHHLVAAPS